MMAAPLPKMAKVSAPKKRVRVMHDEDEFDSDLEVSDARKPKVIGKGITAPKKPYRKCNEGFYL